MTTNNKNIIVSLNNGEREEADNAFRASVQEKIADYLEVRKVELASTIMDDLQEGEGKKKVNESEHTAADELVMYADNDSQLYKSSHQPIVANLKKKVAKGVYDHEKATKLWGYHADRAAMKYAKDHGDKSTPWHKMFTPDDRKKAARQFADNNKSDIHEAIDSGSAARPVGAANPATGRNVVSNVRRAAQTLGIRGVNPVVASQAHSDFAKLVKKNPKTPGYMLLRKLAPNKAASIQNLTQAGVPLGGSLEASPSEFNQVLQRIKRFK